MPKIKPLRRPMPSIKPASRQSRYGIDIGENEVRIIRISSAGVITNAAAADITIPMTEKPDDAYVLALTRAIKQARRSAKLPISWHMPCVLVTGGPYVIIRRFTWPDMPPAALLANTRTELAPYLPEDINAFSVHYRILRRNPKTENTGVTLDILTAAIPVDIAKAVTAAARKAGFKPLRLDIHENARGKLTRLCPIRAVDEDTSLFALPSYALLDIENTQINMTLCVEHIFYSNRFFSSAFGSIAELSDTSSHLEADDAGSVFDTDTMANEISSIIDFIHYRERGSRVEYILLIGDEKKLPGIHQSLTENLDIPVYRVDEWFPKALVRKKSRAFDVSPYIDALGATLPVAQKTAGPPHRLGADIDLKPIKKVHPAAPLLWPMLITVLVLAVLLFIGIAWPASALRLLEEEEALLDRELPAHVITIEDIAQLNQTNTHMTDQIREVAQFYQAYPPASAVLRAIYEPRQSDEIFYQIKSADGVVTLLGETADFNRLASHLVVFREHELFAASTVKTAHAYTEQPADADEKSAGTVFEISLALQPGAGVTK